MRKAKGTGKLVKLPDSPDVKKGKAYPKAYSEGQLFRADDLSWFSSDGPKRRALTRTHVLCT